MGLIEDVHEIAVLSIRQKGKDTPDKAVVSLMYDGKIRIYGYPCQKGKYSEWKFYDRNCRIFSENGILGVAKNGSSVIWKFD